MTTLQDNLKAYARYRTASVLNSTNGSAQTLDFHENGENLPSTLALDSTMRLSLSTSTAVGDTREVEPEEVSATTVYPTWRAESSFDVTVDLVREAGSRVEFGTPTSIVWVVSQPRFLIEGVFHVDSPFDLLDERRGNQEKVRELISYVCSSENVPFAQELASRLEYLNEIAEEEGPEQSELSAESLRMFVKFLELTPDLKFPGVVLPPSGNIRVQWRAAANKLFVAEFYSDGDVRFVIFRPDPKRSGHTIRLSGTASVESLLTIAELHGVLEWVGG